MTASTILRRDRRRFTPAYHRGEQLPCGAVLFTLFTVHILGFGDLKSLVPLKSVWPHLSATCPFLTRLTADIWIFTCGAVPSGIATRKFCSPVLIWTGRPRHGDTGVIEVGNRSSAVIEL